MKPLLSIIIPMYNAQAYIIAAVQSALSRVGNDVEIIVIDDGSTDDSYSICSEIDDDRIRLLRQANAGAPAARNYGLEYARGEYVVFFDADDFFADDAVEYILKSIKETKHDCYIGNFFRYNNGKSTLEYKNMKNVDNLFDFFMFSPSPGSKVYRRNVIMDNQLYFDDLRLAQDLNFYLKFLGVSQDICVIDWPIFHYRYVSNSISHVVDERVLDIVRSIDGVLDYYKKHNVGRECISLAYLNGVKHTNYQMKKLLWIEDPVAIRRMYSTLKENWNRYYAKARITPFNCRYYSKRYADAAIQYFYRLKIWKHLKVLERNGN